MICFQIVPVVSLLQAFLLTFVEKIKPGKSLPGLTLRELKTHIMNEITTNVTNELMKAWIEGWPEYSVKESDDHRSIIQLHLEVAKCLKISTEDLSNLPRICTAITNIANYCRCSERWGSRNIYWANLCFQTLYNEMKTRQRLQRIREQNYNYTKK